MIETPTPARRNRTVAIILFAMLIATLIGMAGQRETGVPTHPVESSFLMEKMWEHPPSSAEVRAGIEAALKIPDWQLRDASRAATQWSRVGGTIVDPAPSVEHDKVGRVRSAAWAWHNSLGETTLWAGASSGGLYFLGRNPVIPAWRIWVPVSQTLPGSPSVGAFLVRAGNSNRILVGTGDWGRSGDEGTGLYRTEDGGATWIRVSLNPDPSHFFKLVPDPADTTGERVLAATSEGVFISSNFGQSWAFVYDGPAGGGVTDITRATASSEWILGVPGTGVVHCSILSTLFHACTAGTGIPGEISRVSVAVSPANPAWVFALVTGPPRNLNGIYRSANAGASFVDMDPRATTDPIAWDQGHHTHAIAVDPADPNRVMVGLAAAQMTLNATTASTNNICWRRNVGVTGSGCDTTGLDAGHVDQTSMAFIPQSVAPGNTEILVTNDGGITAYDWAADSHDDRYNEWGLNISQTYNPPTFDRSLSNPDRLLAGSQDNGNIRIDRQLTTERYRYLFGGDGGQVSIHPNNDTQFAMTSGFAYQRYFWQGEGPQVNMNVNLPGGGTPTMVYNHIINLPVVFTHDGRYLFWRWSWEGNSVNWRYVNPNHPLPAGISIQSIEAGSIDPLVIYITDWNSVSNGIALYVMEEGVTGTLGDMNWEDRTPSGAFVPDVPTGGWVFADRSSQHGSYVYFATGSRRPSRAYLSTNKGGAWWDVTGDLAQSLPNVNYWQVLAHPLDHRQLFLATEVGVFRSDNSGRNWYRYMDGLPAVVKVRGMQIHSAGPDDVDLIIATWGHGFWERTVEFADGLFNDGFET
jgi:hypothetical protein